MKAATLRSIGALHTWVGLVAGFALFIAFYAGAITVFKQQLHTWQGASGRTEPMASLDGAQHLVDAALTAHPAAAAQFWLHLPSLHEPHLRLVWYARPAQGGPLREHEFGWSPQGGLVEITPDSELSHLIDRLHYTAGLPASWGLYVLGVVCVLYGLALVSGVMIYLPSLGRDLFALRIGKNIKRLWQDAHNAVGMLSLPFHLMYAWSSAVLALGLVMLAPFQYLVFDGKLLQMIQLDIAATAPVAPSGMVAPLVPAEQLIASALRAVPGLQIGQLRYLHAGDRRGLVEVYGEVDQRTLTSIAVVVLDTASGKVIRTITPATYSPGTRLLRGLSTLHFGHFGQTAMQWVYFSLGMAGAFLFYSGNLLWIEARRKRQRAVQPRSGRLMAQATLGVCLGSVAGISAAFLVSKLAVVAPGKLPVWEQGTYYAMFFGALAWAFMRRPARAAHELLLLCASLSAALPLAQWWRSGADPATALWRGDWVVVSVNLVALLFALAYWRMARAVLQRGLHGDPCSVWSLLSPPTPPPTLPAAPPEPGHAPGQPVVVDALL